MTEERKHTSFFSAARLCARKPTDSIESGKSNFAKEFLVDKAGEAAFICL